MNANTPKLPRQGTMNEELEQLLQALEDIASLTDATCDEAPVIAMQALQALQDRRTPCVWRRLSGAHPAWGTECGHITAANKVMVSEDGVFLCPDCGRKVREEEAR